MDDQWNHLVQKGRIVTEASRKSNNWKLFISGPALVAYLYIGISCSLLTTARDIANGA